MSHSFFAPQGPSVSVWLCSIRDCLVTSKFFHRAMRHSQLLFSLLLACTSAFSQTAPAIEWQRALGGTGADNGWSIEQTSDSGYIVAGQSASNNGNVTGNHGGYDFWVVKLASDGAVQWQKSLGGTGADYAYCVRQTIDHGYVVVGNSNSNDGDVSGNHGSGDVWVVKLDNTGSLQWQRCLGGSNGEGAKCVLQTSSDGYIIAGETYSNDGDVVGNQGSNDVWLVKLDAGGSLVWQHTYGGSGGEFANDIAETGDGGYVIAGGSTSNDGDVTGNHGGGMDYWLLKDRNSCAST